MKTFVIVKEVKGQCFMDGCREHPRFLIKIKIAYLRLWVLRLNICFAFCSINFASKTFAATYDESLGAARTISSWLLTSASHNDFLSATTTGVRRAGVKFFVKEQPLQMASDYGVSVSRIPINDSIVRAYNTFGLNSAASSRSLNLSRIHATWSFDNAHDFSFSYLHSSSLDGWGIGYKRLFWQEGPVYLSYRLGASVSERVGFYRGQSFSTEIGASYYMKIVDFFVGLRHTVGWSEFDASVPELQLPRVTYFADLGEMEYLAGIVLASTTETRLAFQLIHRQDVLSLAAKFSFRFEALYPTYNNWFRDPRRLKQ